MQERFNLEQAVVAARFFDHMISNKDSKELYLNNSNKCLLFATAIAYYGECSSTKLKRTFPVINIKDATKILVDNNIITETPTGKYGEYMYKYVGDEVVDYKNPDSYNKTMTNMLYLFANCLLNMDVYIKTYKMGSWNVLALMLETTLKVSYTTEFITLGKNDIMSVTGNTSNKLSTRKLLHEYGVLRPNFSDDGERVADGKYMLNRRAYVIERH